MIFLSVGIQAAVAQQLPLPEANGVYDCVIEPKSQVKIGSSDEGIIKELTVQRGDRVRKGDIVARLDSDLQTVAVEIATFRAKRDIDILSGRARLKYRTRTAERIGELSKKRIVAQKSVEEAETERVLAEYGLKAAVMERRMANMELKNAQKLLERRTIRSPVDGVVIEVLMAPGEFAHKQSPLLTVAEVDPLHVEVYLPIARYGDVTTGMIGRVTPEQPIGGRYDAKIAIVDHVFDTASSTFGVRLSLANPKYKLPAGLKCRVRFLPGTARARSDERPGPDRAKADPAESKPSVRPSDQAAAVENGASTKNGRASEPPARRDRAPAPAPEKMVRSATDARPKKSIAKIVAPAKPVTRSQKPATLIRQIKSELVRVGLNPGKVDGNFGALTREAIIAFQRFNRLKVSGRPSRELLRVLKAAESQAIDKIMKSSNGRP